MKAQKRIRAQPKRNPTKQHESNFKNKTRTLHKKQRQNANEPEIHWPASCI
jgi:hypothetical protein